MKILTVVGARPQFIKAAPVSRAIQEAGHCQFLLHTGQHYDHGMSQVFFDELALPAPDVNLAVHASGHGEQTGKMLMGIEQVLLAEKPDWVMVYGDTNSTLAGALAAAKLHIPLAHVEAGLRSFNREMPEEHNRVLTDHCADLLFCPTRTAVSHLEREGITRGVHLVGDPMYDAVLMFSERAEQRSTLLKDLGLQDGGYLLATIHRAYNTDDLEVLKNIFSALESIDEQIIFPIHPRTRARLESAGLTGHAWAGGRIHLIDPVSYLDMLMLEQHARLILTDSGGVQKEAYFFAVPCLTLRPETEWVETVESGWNLLVEPEAESLSEALQHRFPTLDQHPPFFGDGRSAQAMVSVLEQAKTVSA